MVEFRDAIYFTAWDGESGGWWRTDGTVEGTWRAIDKIPGALKTDLRHWVVAGDWLYFTLRTTEGLFVTDGTAAGTRKISDVSPFEPVTPVGDRVFFSGGSPATGWELWTSDGTSEGTGMVKDIAPGSLGSQPWLITASGDVAYFSASTAEHGRELWRSDGTAEGTVMVSDLAAGSASSHPAEMTEYRGHLYFRAEDGLSTDTFWRTDGTPDGTLQVRSIGGETAGHDYLAGIEFMKVVGDKLFFHARTTAAELGDTETFPALFVSDGTAGGTRMIQSFRGEWPFYPGEIFDLNGQAIFSTHGRLWSSDGTAEGTSSIYGGYYFLMQHAVLAGGKLYMTTGYGNDFSQSIVYTDGTAAGTGLIDHRLDYYSSRGLVEYQGKVYIDTSSPQSGSELFVLDPASHELSLVRDINVRTPFGSSPQFLYSGGGYVYFLAGNRYAVYRSDGTSAGTQKLVDAGLAENGFALLPWSPVELDGDVVFAAGGKVYITDGKPEGTKELANFGAGYYVSGFHRAGDRIFFGGIVGADHGLYLVEKTLEGPVARKIGGWFSDAQSPRANAAAIGDVLYYAHRGSAGVELWRSDGSIEGTYPVGGIDRSTVGSAAPRALTAVGDRLFFFISDKEGTYWLYTSDGTAAGTSRVPGAPVAAWYGGLSSSDRRSANMNGVFYFNGGSGEASGLWRSDGTAEGTFLVMTNVYALQMTVAANRLFFVSDGQLWRSDGTPQGTHQISTALAGDTNPEQQNFSGPANLTAIGDEVYFVAQTNEHGIELWRSDGTPEGTELAADLLPGPVSSLYDSTSQVRSPSTLAALGDYVFFAANDRVRGTELWKMRAREALSADAGGPYTVTEGNMVELTGSATAGAGRIIRQYEWDLDFDGISFTADGTGSGIRFSAAGLDGNSTRSVALRVTDDLGRTAVATAMLSITDVAPVLSSLLGADTAVAGEVYKLNLGPVSDPGDDPIQQYLVNWGDGLSDLYTSGGSRTHVYAAGAIQRQIIVSVINDDGTFVVGQKNIAVLDDVQRPFKGNPFVPGQVIQVEDFDISGTADAAYFDIDAINRGNSPYREGSGVDLSYGREGGNHTLVYTAAGEWLEYSIDVPMSGLYDFSISLANASSGAALRVLVEGSDKTGLITVPNTGSYGTYRTVQFRGLTLGAGRQTLRLALDRPAANGSVANIDWMRIDGPQDTAPDTQPPTSVGNLRLTRSTTSTISLAWNHATDDLAVSGYLVWLNGSLIRTIPATQNQYEFKDLSPSTDYTIGIRAVDAAGNQGAMAELRAKTAATQVQYPFTGQPHSTNQFIQAENFDHGGAGVAWHDSDATNRSGAYRNTSVDIGAAGSGNYAITYTAAGEWLEYTITVPVTGNYRLEARLAAAIGGGRFHFEVDGRQFGGQLIVPTTGSYGAYRVISTTAELPAGEHVLRVAMDQGANNGAVANLDWFRLVPLSPQQQELPKLLARDIGAVRHVGSTLEAEGKYRVSGSGNDIAAYLDAFHFAYASLQGDGQITAKIAAQQNTNSWAKAGLMIRESLDADSTFVGVFATPGNGLVLQPRKSIGALSYSSVKQPGEVPMWLRLVRSGQLITAYRSNDGADWSQIGRETIAMRSDVYVGLAVTSHDAQLLSTATFEDVQINI